MSEYARPDVLVGTAWVQEHLTDPNLRIAECDEDVLLYDVGHIPGAVKIDWHVDLQNPVVRDYINKNGFEAVLSSRGIGNDTTVVFYGDKSNWWATYAFWVFQLFGFEKAKIMNGGRQKWVAENRPLSQEIAKYPPTHFVARDRDDNQIRAFRDQVMKHVAAGNPLVDVRSPQEYHGELLAMPGYPQEGAMRGGHIPGAQNIPWSKAVREDGTFKSPDELKELYQSQGITEDKDVIAYCRIGERSSHTWFALKYLLGFPKVRNYDGSWTEWGNLVEAPIERP